MDRALLRTLLHGGPARCLDVLARSQALLAADSAAELLFRTAYLNRSVIFKFVDLHGRERLDPFAEARIKPVRTLIYLPYDTGKPGDGGEAILYTRQALRRLHGQRTNGLDPACARLAEDERVLDVLDAVPAFNPFLLNDAFARHGQPVPRAYLSLDAALAERLRGRLRVRVKPLIVAALPQRHAGIAGAVERLVEAFLAPHDSPDVATIAVALRLEPDEAPDILGAWAHIAYLEDELARLAPAVAAFATWLESCSRPREYLPPDELVDLRQRLDVLRTSVRAAWRRLRGILADYQSTYRTLVFDGEPSPFIRFLREARRHYWQAGDLCGRFEQSVYAFEAYTRPYPHQPLPLKLLDDLVRFLLRTHVVSDEPWGALFEDAGAAAAAGAGAPLARLRLGLGG